MNVTVTSASLADTVRGFLCCAGKLWYLVDPRETTFEFLQEVPDYHQQVNAEYGKGAEITDKIHTYE